MNMSFKMRLTDEAFDELAGNGPVDKTYNEKFDHDREVVNLLLKHSMNEEYILDGTAVQTFAYSQKKYDIFLSHSHKDIDKAKRLAKWLEDEFGLKVFVDSLVWMNCDDLLKGIDDLYCKENDSLYSYEKRNYSTSHVHMMLATALAEAMDRSKCVLFYNTPHFTEIRSDGEISGNHADHEKQITSSPWIYYEIHMVKLLKPKPSIRMYNSAEIPRGVQIEYSIGDQLHQIHSLSKEVLLEWQKSWREKKDKKIDPLKLLCRLWYDSIQKDSSYKVTTN